MAASLALLRKDLRLMFGLLAAFAPFSMLAVWLQLRLMTAGDQVLSYLSLNSLYAYPVLGVLALIAGYHLLSREYYAGTQRFLEALPVRRLHTAAVKYALGFALLWLLALAVWLYTLRLALASEPVSPRFGFLMASRITLYVFALWGVVFALSLLGRLRVPLMAAAALLVLLLDEYSAFELSEFGPLALMDRELFPAERNSFPFADALVSLILGIGGLLLGLGLSGMQDGSLSERLAVPMSRGEKTFLFVMAVLGFGVYTYFGPREETPAFVFSEQFTEVQGRVRVAYQEPRYAPEAGLLITRLAPLAASLEQLVAFPSEDFTLQVSLAPSLGPREYRSELADYRQGMLTSANFLADPLWSTDDFSSFLVHQALSIKSRGRALLEPVHWLVDGFSLWWALHHPGAVAPPPSEPDPYLTLALYATRRLPLDQETLRHWDSASEVLGDGLALSLAYSGWRVLERHQGREAALRLAASEFKRPVHGDVRDWWRDWRQPLAARFEAATGWPWEEFLGSWAEELERLRQEPRYRQALERLPAPEWSIEAMQTGRGVRRLDYRLRFDRPLPRGSRCLALHARLPAVDVPMPGNAIREETMRTPRGARDGLLLEASLSGVYGEGTRIHAAIDCQLPDVGLTLRFGFQKVTMP